MSKRFWLDTLYMFIGMIISIALDLPFFFVPTLTFASVVSAIFICVASCYIGRWLFEN